MSDIDQSLRCSGLADGNRCIHGFKAGIACWPIPGNLTRVPMCCDEEWCGDWFDSNGGKPWPRDEDLARKPQEQKP